jgi:N-acetylglutamate synthase-like GNAT family acetyltransferase
MKGETKMTLEPASPMDEPWIRQLLTICELPHEDITSLHLRHFLVAKEKGQIVGVVGLEVLGRLALLRSLAVDPRYRNRGLASQLTGKAEEHAVSVGSKELYLLTLTAESFFVKRGYQKIGRDSAPPQVQGTAEFQGLCPASSVCMVKQLPKREHGMIEAGFFSETFKGSSPKGGNLENVLAWAYSVLSTTPERWINLTETLPKGLLAKRPAANQWSALECLHHLLDTERWVFPVRIRAFLGGQNFPAFDPDTQGTKPDPARTGKDWAKEFAGLRGENLSLLKRVTPDDLIRKARHEELGMVTLGEMLHEWVGHDLMHMVQAERAMMQPFIKGCGPWQRYFVDHLVRS